MNTNHEPEIIAVVSGKGGVSKTTATANISTALAQQGLKILVGDIDKQSNCTKAFKAYNAKEKTIADVMVKKIDPREVIIATDIENLDIMPGAYEALEMAPELISADVNRSRTNRLKALKELNEYDFIIIDCPPNLDLLTMNVLAVADKVIVPVLADADGIEGLGYILKKIEIAREEFNSKLKLLGIFLSHDRNTVENREVKEQLHEAFKSKFLQTTIRFSAKVAKASFSREPLLIRFPEDKASQDYRELAKEILEKIK